MIVYDSNPPCTSFIRDPQSDTALCLRCGHHADKHASSHRCENSSLCSDAVCFLELGDSS